MITCWGCNQKGHYKTECTNRHLWDKEAVRRIAAGSSKRDGKKSVRTEGKEPEESHSSPSPTPVRAVRQVSLGKGVRRVLAG